MRFAQYGESNADTVRAEALVSLLRAQRASDLATKLRQMSKAVYEPTEFRETSAELGALLGFRVVVEGPDVEWQLDYEGQDVGVPSPRRTFSEPDDVLVSELASAASRLATLLEELGWRTRLPTSVAELAIERGFSRQGLSTTDLIPRL